MYFATVPESDQEVSTQEEEQYRYLIMMIEHI